MYIDEPKIELSYLAHLSCCVISTAIRDYHQWNQKQQTRDYFQVIRKKINNIHGQDALDWLHDRNDSALSFSICCLLIERALANKTIIADALRHKKDGLLFDPDILREKILKNPIEMKQIFKELAFKLENEDVRVDLDEISEISVRDKKNNVIQISLDLLVSDDTDSEDDFDSEVSTEAAVG